MRILVTGGAGFIGSNFVRYLSAQYPDYRIVVVDKLTYAGNLSNLSGLLQDPRVQFARLDVCDPAVSDVLRGCDAVIHFAAESHVDRSIEDASAFVRTNITGTWQMVEACRQTRITRFIQISTDEVYGSLGPDGKFAESSPLAPNSPYAASKASADLLVLSYVHTHRFPAIITRCSNNYGPYQFPEKFVPLMIAQALADKPLPIYGDGRNVRDWIHVWDHCRALDLILHKGKDGEVYNIGGECELQNLETAHAILDILGKPHRLVSFVSDRPGHDRHYAINCDKLKNTLGWRRTWDFQNGLSQTIQWYRENQQWLDEVRSGAYQAYLNKHYVHREPLLARVENA